VPEEGKPVVEVDGDAAVEEETDRLNVPAPGMIELLRVVEVVDFPPLEVKT
jgi:hypothetical protein